MSDSDSDEIDIFADPENYYPPSPKPTTASHTLLSGVSLTLRLIGHNPLWGHLLWNAGRIISNYLEKNQWLVDQKTVLELGAGAGLPSLVSGLLGAKRVVVTDYPDADLIENLTWNIEHFQADLSEQRIEADIITAMGYCWGADVEPLLSQLSPSSFNSSAINGIPKFDILILADLLFNHSEHTKLVSTIAKTLSKDANAKALVFFTPYRPWLLQNDLAFFDLVRDAGFVVEKVLEEKMEEVMFVEDRGDPELRRTVFGYVVRWAPDGGVEVQSRDVGPK